MTNDGRPATGGWRDDSTDPDRIWPALLWLLLRKLRLGEVLGTNAQLAVVVAVAAGCDALRDDTGLVAAIFMGLALANMRSFDIPARRPFFETLVQLIISVLFISISATVTPQSLRHLILPTLVLVAVLVIVARPVASFAATLRRDLAKGERAFIGWMAPRGMVSDRYARGARIIARRADGEPSAEHDLRFVGHDLLFLVRADGHLIAATQADTPVPQAGDTLVSLGPVPVPVAQG